MVHSFIKNHHLIWRLTQREIKFRSQGSYLGVLWSVLTPLFTLALFSVIFGFIFQGRFTGHPNETAYDFAPQLFAGLVIFNVFSECIVRGPTLITTSANYVTKVVFPLEVLPVVAVLNAMVTLLFSLAPLIGCVWLFHGHLPLTLVYWPALLLPITLFAFGISWILASLGVFFRDLSQITGVVAQFLIYASAVVYPLERLPVKYRWVIALNPIAYFVSESRNLVVWGTPSLNWSTYGIFVVCGVIFASFGYSIFMRSKAAFADLF